MNVYLLHQTVDLGSHVISAHKTREGAELSRAREVEPVISFQRRVGGTYTPDYLERLFFIEEVELQE
jgi:hypothetical protein